LAFGTKYSYASHMIGGNFEMEALDKFPGRYRISAFIYMDEIQNRNGPRNGDLRIGIIRKRDHTLVQDLYLIREDKDVFLTYSNQACAAIRSLKTRVQRYNREITLNPNDYDDAQGYYLTYSQCCRNPDIDNIEKPDQHGNVFYLEFPALKQNGRLFLNSSPTFNEINGEYICINTQFKMNFGAEDSDGDDLKYSLVTPWVGIVGDRIEESFQPNANYPEAKWLAGFNAQNAIPGSPPLSISSKGILTVKANTLGLFVFTVQVEEFRNGVKIGLVRREFQLLVIDCPPSPVPNPVLSAIGYPVNTSEVSVCFGKEITFETNTNPNWEYQWQLDDDNIKGATTNSLNAKEPGIYTVNISQKNTCSATRESRVITLKTKADTTKLNTSNKSVCFGETVKVNAKNGTGLTYEWFRNGKKILNEANSSLFVKDNGKYSAYISEPSSSCILKSDTIKIDFSFGVPVKLTALKLDTTLCEGESISLYIDSPKTDVKYSWYNELGIFSTGNQTSLNISKKGNYFAKSEDVASCKSTSDTVKLDVLDKIKITFDKIDTLCSDALSIVNLKATPSGGVFSGKGVTDVNAGTFDPKKAGTGSHDLTYQISGNTACRSGKSAQKVVILALPVITLPKQIQAFKGNSVILNSGNNKGYTYKWQPDQWLNNANVGNPESSPLQAIEYQLIVSDKYGCASESKVLVSVSDRIYIPNAFTPNGDGDNEVWELRGLENYPEAEVTVFNRWGNVVFYSKGYSTPFDGTYKGEPLPTGTYAYQVVTEDQKYILRGGLELMR
jgi:gliding motility-associated-like protein